MTGLSAGDIPGIPGDVHQIRTRRQLDVNTIDTAWICLFYFCISCVSLLSTMSLSPTNVMVTGASRGLGLEFVKQLIKLPTAPQVIIAACREPSSAAELQDIARSNPSVQIVKLDMTKDEEIQTAVEEVSSFVGTTGLNLLICNAGIASRSIRGETQDVTREIMQEHFNVNVTGPVIVTQKFLPLLKKAASFGQSSELSASKSGVVMVTSLLGSQTKSHTEDSVFPSCMHYRCSKTALNMATVLMARELKELGILVTALHPGWVKTDMGTSSAPLSPEESIQGCLQVVGNAGREHHGKVVDFKGNILQY
ncbi:hypothetical protein Btru_066655 [Bulinus truncatus]|nr:hypothetical protein Btru_066655 [Bulinus truncatus]